MTESTISNKQDHLCVLCFKSFKYNSLLKTHHRLVHEKSKTEWINCEVCGLHLPKGLEEKHLRAWHS